MPCNVLMIRLDGLTAPGQVSMTGGQAPIPMLLGCYFHNQFTHPTIAKKIDILTLSRTWALLLMPSE